jgi:hypothetical protein
MTKGWGVASASRLFIGFTLKFRLQWSQAAPVLQLALRPFVSHKTPD